MPKGLRNGPGANGSPTEGGPTNGRVRYPKGVSDVVKRASADSSRGS